MKKIRPASVPTVLALACLAATSAHFAPAQQQEGRPLRVEVDTVALNVLVLDRGGSPIAGLTKDDFRVYEDGIEQKVENFFAVDAPFSVTLTLDTSFSAVDKLAVIQDSAIGFIRALHPDDEVMVVSFDDEVHLETDFTRDHDRAERAVKQTRTGDSTQLYEAVYLSTEELRRQPDRKVLVLFTDGVDTASRTTSMKDTLEFAKESDVSIYTIFFDTEKERIQQLYRGGGPLSGPLGTPGTIPGRNPGPVGGGNPLPVPMPVPRNTGDLRRAEDQIRMEYLQAKSYLRELAKITGGKAFQVRGDLLDLGAAFEQIAEELRSLYTLGYVSSNQKEDRKYRKLKVVVERDGARVRTREGYYPPNRKKR